MNLVAVNKIQNTQMMSSNLSKHASLSMKVKMTKPQDTKNIDLAGKPLKLTKRIV